MRTPFLLGYKVISVAYYYTKKENRIVWKIDSVQYWYDFYIDFWKIVSNIYWTRKYLKLNINRILIVMTYEYTYDIRYLKN